MAESESWMPTQPTIRLYAITSAVLGALFLVLLVLYIGALQRNRNTVPDAHGLSPADTTAQTSLDSQAAIGIPAEPAKVMTRTGTIVRITKDEIVFTATMFDKNKGAYVETEMTALTKDARYTELDKTKDSPPIPGQPSQTSATSTQRNSLQPGDRIHVFSSANIQGSRKFTVTEVRLLLY